MLISLTTARRACAGPFALTLLTITLAGCGSSNAGNPPPSATTRSAPATTAKQPRPDAEASYAIPVVSHAQPRQLAAFALLGTPPEGIPAATQRILHKPAFGINWRLAQRIPVKSDGTYWLVPGNRYLCVISQDVMGGAGVGTTCAPTSQAIAHGIADISITLPGAAHRARLIVGVAPNGVREVLVHTRGATATAPTHDGVFVLRDATLAPPDTISLH
jgi:hypothetical protein